MTGMPSMMKYQKPRINIKAFSVGYLGGKIFVVFGSHFDSFTDFTLYRDDVEIASTKRLKEGEASPFQRPEIFDRDHHTNLFFKDSPYKLLYIDEDVHKFQWYRYKILCETLKGNTVVKSFESEETLVQSQ